MFLLHFKACFLDSKEQRLTVLCKGKVRESQGVPGVVMCHVTSEISL